MDPNLYVYPVGGIAALSILIGLILRFIKLQAEASNELAERFEALQADHQWCNERVDMLIRACQQGGISVPQAVWVRPKRGSSA